MGYIDYLNSNKTYSSNVLGNIDQGIADVAASGLTITIDSGILLAGGGGSGGTYGANGNPGGSAIFIEPNITQTTITNYGYLLGGGGGGGGFQSAYAGNSMGGAGGCGGGGGGGGYGNLNGGAGGDYNGSGAGSNTSGGGGGWGYSGAGRNAGISSSSGGVTVGGGGGYSTTQNGYVYGGGAGNLLGGGGGAGNGPGNYPLFGGGGGGGSGGGRGADLSAYLGVGSGGRAGWGILNNGEISSLVNSQCAQKDYGPLYLIGNVPTNYSISLISTSIYGQLYFNPEATTLTSMTFNLSNDLSTNSVLNSITTQTILINVIVGMEFNTPPSGTFTKGYWYLVKNVITSPEGSSATPPSFTCYDLVLVPYIYTGYTFNYNGSIKDFAEVFQLNTTGATGLETEFKIKDGTDLGKIFACYSSPQGTITTGYLIDNADYKKTDLGKLFIPITSTSS